MAQTLRHITIRTLVKKNQRFPKAITFFGPSYKLAGDDHQLVWHVVGTDEQIDQATHRFEREMELFVSAMNKKESRKNRQGEIIRPRYFCDAYVTTEYMSYDVGGEYPLVVEVPNAFPA